MVIKKIKPMGVVSVCLVTALVHARFATEDERVEAYNAKGHKWPPHSNKLRPATAEFRHLVMKRAGQLKALKNREQRWEGWINLAKQVMVPPFTDTGFKVVDGPRDLHKKLAERLHAALKEKNLPSEDHWPLEILGPQQVY